jgi:hypothetical protein
VNAADKVAWTEYDYAAKVLASQGHGGALGDPLPDGLSPRCCELIDEDPEAFQRRVRETAYGLAMARVDAARASVWTVRRGPNGAPVYAPQEP